MSEDNVTNAGLEALLALKLMRDLLQEEMTSLRINHTNPSFRGPNEIMELTLGEYSDKETILRASGNSHLDCLISLTEKKQALSR